MNNICMCEEHSKMIREASTEVLQKMSTDQLTIVEQVNCLLDGFNNPNWPEMQALGLVDKHEKIIENFEKYRDNAQQIFDIVQEELKKRFSSENIKCLIPGVHGFTTTIHPDGSVTRQRELKETLANLHSKE